MVSLGLEGFIKKKKNGKLRLYSQLIVMTRMDTLQEGAGHKRKGVRSFVSKCLPNRCNGDNRPNKQTL